MIVYRHVVQRYLHVVHSNLRLLLGHNFSPWGEREKISSQTFFPSGVKVNFFFSFLFWKKNGQLLQMELQCGKEWKTGDSWKCSFVRLWQRWLLNQIENAGGGAPLFFGKIKYDHRALKFFVFQRLKFTSYGWNRRKCSVTDLRLCSCSIIRWLVKDSGHVSPGVGKKKKVRQVEKTMEKLAIK